jgi:hypothetical protein
MENLNLFNLILNSNTQFLAVLFFFSALLLTIFYTVRYTALPKINAILKKKKKTAEAIASILNILNNVEACNTKLLKEYEVVESFNESTVATAIEECSRIENVYPDLLLLDEITLAENLKFYFDGQIKMLGEMLKLEDSSYKFQKDYQQRVLYYNREFERCKGLVSDAEDVSKLRYDIGQELEKMRKTVLMTIEGLKIRRKEFNTELANSQNLLSTLKQEVLVVNQKKVATRSFHFRYLSFA